MSGSKEKLGIFVWKFPSPANTFIFNEVMGLYEKGVDFKIYTFSKEPDSDKSFYQDKLKLIPLWSEKMIEEEVNRIKIVSNCNYLEELIESLFSAYSQMFILVNNEKYDNPIKIPSHHYVIHNCYITIARALWKQPDYFYHRYDTKKIQSSQEPETVGIKKGPFGRPLLEPKPSTGLK